MKRLDWFIARRYLASRRKGRFLSLITVIAVGGIALGVMALITVIAVMTGLQRDLQEKILGNHPHIYVFEAGQAFRLTDPDRVLGEIRGISGVQAADPFVMTQVVALRESIEYAQFGVLHGIDAASESEPLTAVQGQIQSGELAFGPTVTGRPGILVGHRLAARLGLLPGDVLAVISGENIKVDPMGNPVPVTREFEVTGMVETGMYEYDNQNLYTSIEAAQDLLELPVDVVGGVAVNVTDPWNSDAIAAQIDEALGYAYYTQDWRMLNSSLFSALKLEKLAMGIILSLIILVAAFNIVSTLTMVVRDKTKEIGILKSMGLTDGQVLRVFLLQGLAIGVIGTTLGTIGGLILVWALDRYQFIEIPGDVYFIDRLPVALAPLDLVMIVVTSLLIALLATIYPARQASRLLPVEAIRHE